ncbi:uncharacterized protein PHACADRAFT_89854 [Phanerochaete carnosa HHB-10118-sp]|uniref:Uncharacterized protein n=1 Tax=Phanerochaete carnosa (strain HHB-10118-sp) TaxID=650164 RepID=K5WF64_PHACS|nr:uncharacterized protein PHACADRAFT_89854 [Phanerochaete carnosa HHB-10118-sp]EKM57920.1 hypothetical protein PHACADRAFT_89854 [Phanerochaete carnosa HHB-10118-sp]
MIKVANYTFTKLSAAKLDKHTKGCMPIWYHLGSSLPLSRLQSLPQTSCLWSIHRVYAVSDALRITVRLNAQLPQCHLHRKNCGCNPCRLNHEASCCSSNKCCMLANELIANLRLRWHPSHLLPVDNLTVTD